MNDYIVYGLNQNQDCDKKASVLLYITRPFYLNPWKKIFSIVAEISCFLEYYTITIDIQYLSYNNKCFSYRFNHDIIVENHEELKSLKLLEINLIELHDNYMYFDVVLGVNKYLLI